MLTITVPKKEYVNQDNSITKVKECVLTLEHSLVSISKWEAKFHRSFFGDQQMTDEETLYYVKCMTITQNVNPMVYLGLTKEHYDRILKYMEDPMTATWFTEVPGKSKNKFAGRTITSEIIYYLMIQYQIPVKFEKWHINRLLVLIRVCNEKSQPTKKMSKKDVMLRNQAINARNRARFHSKG